MMHAIGVTYLAVVLGASAAPVSVVARPPQPVSAAPLKPYWQEKVDWNGVVARLPAGNVFRVILPAKYEPSKNGANVASPEDQRIVAEYDADMRKAASILGRGRAHLAGVAPALSAEELADLRQIRAKYDRDRNELYQAVLASPELSVSAKEQLNRTLRPMAKVLGIEAVQPATTSPP
jgi:hypothetical protein